MMSEYRFRTDLFADEQDAGGFRHGFGAKGRPLGMVNVTEESSSEVRTERVLAVQQALKSGVYGVRAEELAGRLMDRMLRPH